MRLLVACRKRFERRDVVENPEAPPLGDDDEIFVRCTARSVTGVTGRLSCSGCQRAPLSVEKYRPNSRAGKQRPVGSGSSRTTRTG